MTYTLPVSGESGEDFELCPAGPIGARCIDIVDLGRQQTEWKGQVKTRHKVDIYWLTTHPKSDGSGMLSVRQRYTLSLGEKSNLFRDLTAWRGKAFTAEELAEFDIEKLVGAPCFFNVAHRVAGNGKTYANPTSFMPLPKGMEAPDMPTDYIRHAERNPSIDRRSPNYQAPQSNQQAAPQNQAANQYQHNGNPHAPAVDVPGEFQEAPAF